MAEIIDLNAGKAGRHLAEIWNFPWHVMEVFVGGKSAIDVPRLGIQDDDDAMKFLSSYGFNCEKPEDLRAMHQAFVEAVSFIERQLIPEMWGSGVKPPEAVLQCIDPRQLLIWASQQDRDDKAMWSCAILRVMHTIGHIEGVYQSAPFQIARDRVRENFARHIFKDENGVMRLGDSRINIELHSVEWKTEKSRDSILLKLLHKAANVAETIYDLFGVRIVTKRLCDVMVAVKFLRQFNIVSYPNSHPSRVRNTLVDVDKFMGHVESLRHLLTSGVITSQEFNEIIERLTEPALITRRSNPHSGTSYRSIQLTCRELIRCPNPVFGWMDDLRRLGPGLIQSNRQFLKHMMHLIETWPGVEKSRNISVFFPFEVQILDETAFFQSLSGSSSHSQYKQSQIKAARRRVLHEVLKSQNEQEKRHANHNSP